MTAVTNIWAYLSETSDPQIEPINECIDKPDNVVRPHIVVH